MRSKILMAVLTVILIGTMAGTIYLQIFQNNAENKRLKEAYESRLSLQNSSLANNSREKLVEKEKYLKIEDLVVGTGQEVKSGDTISVKYKGMLENGTVFDESKENPLKVQIGVGQLIKGWDEGIVGMKVGGKRKLTIQPEWGYGSHAQGKIPANSVLIFEVEMLDVK